MADTSVGIIDYGVGNIFSVIAACKKAELSPKLIRCTKDIESVKGLILPGVGAFRSAYDSLQKLNLYETLQKSALSGMPLLGICLGMQFLMEESQEFGITPGLKLIKGNVVSLKENIPENSAIKVPHIGWNKIYFKNESFFNQSSINSLFSGISSESEFYFVHSFSAVPADSSTRIAESNYEGHNFCSIVGRDNILGVQFHPERSGKKGLLFYKNWANFLEKN